MTELEEILKALKVDSVRGALQKIELFEVWNKHDVKIISELRKEIKLLKDGQGKHN